MREAEAVLRCSFERIRNKSPAAVSGHAYLLAFPLDCSPRARLFIFAPSFHLAYRAPAALNAQTAKRSEHSARGNGDGEGGGGEGDFSGDTVQRLANFNIRRVPAGRGARHQRAHPTGLHPLSTTPPPPLPPLSRCS